ncbi:hypothetical protein HK101_002294, partial [Irineochytrium annulatum]
MVPADSVIECFRQCTAGRFFEPTTQIFQAVISRGASQGLGSQSSNVTTSAFSSTDISSSSSLCYCVRSYPSVDPFQPNAGDAAEFINKHVSASSTDCKLTCDDGNACGGSDVDGSSSAPPVVASVYNFTVDIWLNVFSGRVLAPPLGDLNFVSGDGNHNTPVTSFTTTITSKTYTSSTTSGTSSTPRVTTTAGGGVVVSTVTVTLPGGSVTIITTTATNAPVPLHTPPVGGPGGSQTVLPISTSPSPPSNFPAGSDAILPPFTTSDNSPVPSDVTSGNSTTTSTTTSTPTHPNAALIAGIVTPLLLLLLLLLALLILRWRLNRARERRRREMAEAGGAYYYVKGPLGVLETIRTLRVQPDCLRDKGDVGTTGLHRGSAFVFAGGKALAEQGAEYDVEWKVDGSFRESLEDGDLGAQTLQGTEEVGKGEEREVNIGTFASSASTVVAGRTSTLSRLSAPKMSFTSSSYAGKRASSGAAWGTLSSPTTLVGKQLPLPGGGGATSPRRVMVGFGNENIDEFMMAHGHLFSPTSSSSDINLDPFPSPVSLLAAESLQPLPAASSSSSTSLRPGRFHPPWPIVVPNDPLWPISVKDGPAWTKGEVTNDPLWPGIEEDPFADANFLLAAPPAAQDDAKSTSSRASSCEEMGGGEALIEVVLRTPVPRARRPKAPVPRGGSIGSGASGRRGGGMGRGKWSAMDDDRSVTSCETVSEGTGRAAVMDLKGENGLPNVVVVVGTTGVGKSNLAIEIARSLNGEVINADSMQVYEGLDIVTNKVTDEERKGVVHHLLGFVDPAEEYSVGQFEKDALRTIADIHSRNKLPILVGGTHYYIQSLLWRNSLIARPEEPDNA